MIYALDTETTGPDLHHGCCPFYVAICDIEGGQHFYEWDVDPLTRQVNPNEDDLQSLSNLLSDPDNTFVFHNTKFDVRALDRLGILSTELRDHILTTCHDTLIMSHALDSFEEHGLKTLALKYLDIPDDDQSALQTAVNKARTFARSREWDVARSNHPHWPSIKCSERHPAWAFDMWLPREVAKHRKRPKDDPFWTVCRQYADTDALRTIALYRIFKHELEEQKLWESYSLKKSLLRPTYLMEERGMGTRPEVSAIKSEEFSAIRGKYLKGLKEKTKNPRLNPNSDAQLRECLFNEMGITPTEFSKKTKLPSVGKDFILDSLGIDKPSQALELYDTLDTNEKTLVDLLMYRRSDKCLSYLKEYQLAMQERDGHFVLHPSFNITGTKTTRLSSSNPNAQNISNKEGINIRGVFGPRPGYEWFAIDYSNIELRLFAYASGEQRLIDAFEQGESAHLVFAAVLHGHDTVYSDVEAFKKDDRYKFTKNGNFSLIYGAAKARADRTYRVDNAYEIIRSQLTEVDRFMASIAKEVRRKARVTTIGNPSYQLFVPRKEPYKGTNYIIQGTAGFIMNVAMIRCQEFLDEICQRYDWSGMMPPSMICQVHDELIFEFPKSSRNKYYCYKLAQIMEEVALEMCGIPVPAEPDVVTESWGAGIPADRYYASLTA